ncbi:MAG: SUMF1/EgtB/PvdO family nonheme iron enzyme [Chitinispirillaceae bacterium]|nr:SUMF1/EgtB/PvdO family nonheme iron enzyme [Chitinispirillaceae bacterium]
MSRTGRKCILTALSCTSIFILCSTDEQSDFPRTAIIVGRVELVRKGEHVMLEPNRRLHPGDTLLVKENSKVKFECAAGAAWYLNRGSELAIDEAVPLSGEKRRLAASLLKGQLHIVKRDETCEEYLIATPSWTIRVTMADISICAGNNVDTCGIMLLSGFATFTPPGGTETVIPACSRLRPSETGPGTLEPLRTADIASVKGWVGSTVVEKALIRSGCTIGEAAAVNEPPRWRRLPRETALRGESFVDTVEAVDPEKTDIAYALVEAPEGMTLDERSGILTCTAQAAGDHALTLTATDADAHSCTTRVFLSVSAGLSLRLLSPRTAEPGKPISISLLPRGVDKKKVRYRFDLNGDGKIDVPADGTFGIKSKVNRHRYINEGVFHIKAEARSDDGQTASVRRSIVVNAPPAAVLKAVPALVTLGTPVELDVSASTDTRNGATPLKVRYDIDGNGTWDLPEGNQFLTATRATYAWEHAGTYRIIAEITDMDGASSTAGARVVVSKGVTGGSIDGPDTVHAGDSVKFTCIPQAPEFPVREFVWSLNGDSVYGKKGTQATARTLFHKSGRVTVFCRMTDEKGRQGTVSKRIMVINSAAAIDAGGPYRVGVNKPVVLEGSGSDRDSRIVGYSWDADGDGTIDWSSKAESKAKHTYKKAGVYTACFYITTDDGRKVADSARVEVINKPPTASAGDDIISRKNRKVKLVGTAADEDGTISLYEWDFNNDGVMDWSSKENGNVEHAFEVYTASVFRVRDSDGDSASDTVRIIICPDDMRTIEGGGFCIDAYEFPNQRNGRPKTDVSYEEALQFCRNAGKRLCTAAEWETACRDVNLNYEYPYGTRYDVGRCNTLGNPRVKNSVAVSGDFIECKNSAGVFDMSGNAAEWVESGKGNSFVYGGSWQNGEEGSGCGSKIQLRKGRKYFYAGFRCCK